MGELIHLDSFRPRGETVADHSQMVMNADVNMLRRISSWAECLSEISEHFEEPLHPSDRKTALNMLALIDGQPVQL